MVGRMLMPLGKNFLIQLSPEPSRLEPDGSMDLAAAASAAACEAFALVMAASAADAALAEDAVPLSRAACEDATPLSIAA